MSSQCCRMLQLIQSRSYVTLNHAALLRCHATLPGPYHRWKPPPWQLQRWCHHGHGASNALRNGNGKEGLPEQPNVTSLDMLKSMKNYVWPADNPAVKRRVLGSLGLLVTAKCLNTYVPILFKDVINLLNKAETFESVDSIANSLPSLLQPLLSPSISIMSSPAEAVGICATSLVIGYGIARAGAFGFSELRNAVFAKVAQHSIRRIALNVFGHLHNLDLAFHLNRQTGALSKVRTLNGRTLIVGQFFIFLIGSYCKF